MAWSASKVFVSTIEDILENTTAIDLNSSSFYITLWANTITPDQTVTSANTAFGAGVWASGEKYDGTEWPTGGQALGNVSFAPTSNVLKWDADDEVSAGTNATLVDVYGSMIYCYDVATPVDNQGICFLYFGGVQSVTGGQFTVAFNSTNGIFTLTL
jgi:hypothetical protein